MADEEQTRLPYRFRNRLERPTRLRSQRSRTRLKGAGRHKPARNTASTRLRCRNAVHRRITGADCSVSAIASRHESRCDGVFTGMARDRVDFFSDGSRSTSRTCDVRDPKPRALTIEPACAILQTSASPLEAGWGGRTRTYSLRIQNALRHPLRHSPKAGRVRPAQSLYGSNSPSPAITTANGRSVCRTFTVPAC